MGSVLCFFCNFLRARGSREWGFLFGVGGSLSEEGRVIMGKPYS